MKGQGILAERKFALNAMSRSSFSDENATRKSIVCVTCFICTGGNSCTRCANVPPPLDAYRGRSAALKHRIPFDRMQSFSAGTHDAFPRLQWQPAGHAMPEANERQFGLPFICAGWFTLTIQNGRLAKSRAADCCSIRQSAARAKVVCQSVSDRLRIREHS